MIKDNKNKIIKAIIIGLAINVFLTLLKLITGIWGNSQSLISDGLNSFSDIFISIILLVVFKISTKKPDHDHHYGHEKFEGLAYFFLGIMFIITAFVICYFSVSAIVSYVEAPTMAEKPKLITLIIAVIALVTKIFLFRYYIVISNKYNSSTLKADSKNHMIDAMATFFSVIGITLSQFNLILFDYIAAVIIGLFILKLALSVLKESITYLVDASPSQDVIDNVYREILSVSGVLSIDDLKIRMHMTQKYVDVEIGVLGSLNLKDAHDIAENVHDHIENKFTSVIHCFVHVNPKEDKLL